MILECYAGVLSWYANLVLRELDLCGVVSNETLQIFNNTIEIGRDIVRRCSNNEPGNNNNLNFNTQKSN